MDKTLLFLLVLFLAVCESQRIRPGPGRCPAPRGAGICVSTCQPGRPGRGRRGWGTCPRGLLCCRNGCGAYTCTRPVGPIRPPGITFWCPPGSPRIRCFVNPCSIMRCPGLPFARCRPTNPCKPGCTGAFYYSGRRVPNWLCNIGHRLVPSPYSSILIEYRVPVYKR